MNVFFINFQFLSELVYPGAFYLDLSKLSTQQAVENILIASDPDLHAAVLSAKVEIVPNFSHHTGTKH